MIGTDLAVTVGLEAAAKVDLDGALLFDEAEALARTSGTCSCSERDQTSANRTLELRPVEANVKLSSKIRCKNLRIGVISKMTSVAQAHREKQDVINKVRG